MSSDDSDVDAIDLLDASPGTLVAAGTKRKRSLNVRKSRSMRTMAHTGARQQRQGRGRAVQKTVSVEEFRDGGGFLPTQQANVICSGDMTTHASGTDDERTDSARAGAGHDNTERAVAAAAATNAAAEAVGASQSMTSQMSSQSILEALMELPGDERAMVLDRASVVIGDTGLVSDLAAAAAAAAGGGGDGGGDDTAATTSTKRTGRKKKLLPAWMADESLRKQSLLKQIRARHDAKDQLRRLSQQDELATLAKAKARANGATAATATTTTAAGDDAEDAEEAVVPDRIFAEQLAASSGRVICFDCETTGFAGTDCIIEIAAVELIDGFRTGATFQSYMQPSIPGTKIHYMAYQCHGITAKALRSEPAAPFVLASFIDWIGSAVLVAHNARFDIRMLEQELHRLKLAHRVQNRYLCSMRYARALLGKGAHVSLDELAERFNVGKLYHRASHSALVDAEMMARVYQSLLDIQDR